MRMAASRAVLPADSAIRVFTMARCLVTIRVLVPIWTEPCPQAAPVSKPMMTPGGEPAYGSKIGPGPSTGDQYRNLFIIDSPTPFVRNHGHHVTAPASMGIWP